MSTRVDCRKFAPNIFNKSKCTNCFRQKEEHSAEALESNRASRKISKCGYLFVAPGWDFSNPLNRTKRWQRRWFVLYDDGELTYSLDEHPDTVPQACVDMTLVLEVRDADEVTGHPFSLAITSPDRVTFIKGTCREETRWWSDVLTVYPRNKGRHKRNATFPGGQASSLLQNGTTIRNGAGNLARPRHNSCHAGGWAAPPRPPLPEPVQPMSPLPPQPTSPLPAPEPKVYTDQPVSSASPPTRDKINSEDKARSRRGAARGRTRGPWPLQDPSDPQHDVNESVHHRILLEEYESESKREEKLKDIARSLTRPRERAAPSPPEPDPPTREVPVLSETLSPAMDSPSDSVDGNMPDKYLRGDPDGCVRGAAARVELPAEDLLNMRKGWLLRQAVVPGTSTSTGARHWFVLRGAALLYYRDPSAEDCGIMDGVIDLNGVASVTEMPPARTYGFIIKTWDNRQYTLSALTAGIRANWMSAIRRTAGLPDPSLECSDKLYPEKQLINLERQESVETIDSNHLPPSPVTPITTLTPRTILFSSDEEYRTASEGGRRDSVDWGDNITQLPPSPVPNRNPISRVKDKVRSRNIQHPSSSPQSDETPTSDIDDSTNHQDRSLRDILDPYQHIVADKLRQEEFIKPLKSSYISTIDKQAIEIEDLRKQLKIALNDVNSTEKELKRLRQIKSESILREKKIDELLSTLQQTEDELNRRTKEAENLETLKKMYNEDKNLWESKLTETEAFLKESTEHCILLNKQLEHGQETIKQLQAELSHLNDRLLRGAEENEVLFMKIREIEGRGSSLSITKNKGRSMESLSDLANIDLDQELETMNKERIIEEYDELKCRFEKAIQEIRAMKRELRESHNLYDELELANLSLKRDIQLREESNQSQISMMAARIQDLTLKLSNSDKQVRALKHKLQKSESRDKRRSLSLKGKDSFSIGKEVEEKLYELENKISVLEGTSNSSATPVIQPPSKPPSPTKEKSSADKENEKSLKRLSARLRRKSLDSATSSEPMKMLIRLSSLETKVGNALESRKNLATSCDSLNQIISDNHSADSVEGYSSSSHRHLLDRLQSLENVVISSRNKVNECICQVNAIRSSRNRRSPSPILDKSYSMKSIERCLFDVSKTLQDCTDRCVLPFESIYEGGDLNDSVLNVVSQLETQLRTKLLDINKKKCALIESGEFNQRRSLEFLAEKLAYEAVLISRIHDSVTNLNENSLYRRLIKSEAEETSQLVISLQSKLNGSQIKNQTVCKTSMDYLAKILSRKINIINSGVVDKFMNQSQNSVQIKEIEMLKTMQKELNISFNQYKSDKMIELTKALLIEALNCQSETGFNYDQQRSSLENIRVQEAWNKAQDIVNNELINSEISHVMTRCAQYYASQMDSEKNARFTLVASQQAALEKWFQIAHQQLSIEMERAIAEISSHYQECLTTVRLRSPLNEDRSAVDSCQLLYQLSDVIAHKALIDSKIYVCSGGFNDSNLGNINEQSVYSNDSAEDRIWDKMTESDNVVASLDVDPTQEAEFIYLFQHFSNECRSLFSDEYMDNKEDLTKISDALRQVELVVKHLHQQIDEEEENKENFSANSENRTQVGGVLELCESIKKSVEALSSHIPCQHCLQLQNAISRLRTEHEETLATLKAEQERGNESRRSLDLVRGRARTAEELLSSLQQQHKSAQRRAQRSEAEAKQLKQQIADHQSECEHLKNQHEQEQAQLKERARRLEKRLGTLDSEYSQQLEQLRSAYHKSIGADIQGDSIRQRYQAEIEQLRVLCEKGLLAMESSHRRIIQELEEKHRAEREQLRVDKEQALAEETQATLAALDAMRKAHENEVQREVSKFKREFATRTQQGADLGQMHSRHQEEMEEIKQEILSLSEKYSSKCVESAALEEKLCNVTQQLTQAQHHIMQLDARNKQLRAHLVSEMNEINNSDLTQNGAIIDNNSSPKTTKVNQLTLEPAKSVIRKTKIQFAKTENTRNLRLSPVQN